MKISARTLHPVVTARQYGTVIARRPPRAEFDRLWTWPRAVMTIGSSIPLVFASF
jgi:hypothetical protein